MQLPKYTSNYQKSILFSIILSISLIVGLGCSAGKLLVQSTTPTPTPFKTPRPTYTFTPDFTATFTPSPTFTSTPTETPTATPSPTATNTSEGAEESESAPPPPPPPPPPPAAPAEPEATPTPEEPTATPAPEFPFAAAYFIHETGSPGETRMTAWIRVDKGPGIFKTLSGFQMKAIAPDGNTYLSEISGSGPGDSTVKGTGDNHNMNTKLEIRPYTPGDYTIFLVEGGIQVSPEYQITLTADPLNYVHFDFSKSEPKQ